MTKPKVSICCITYNHSHFLRKAIDSFLAQSGDYELEIIISDDYSSDGTQEIIKEYAIDYSDIIKPILSQVNQGVWANFKKCLMSATGDFIAYCDGDDYYTSPDKLQIQLNALQSNPRCSFCFHDTAVVAEDETHLYSFSKGRLTHNKGSQVFSAQAVIGASLLAAHANSLFFRRDTLEKHKSLFNKLDKQSGGDYQLLFALCLDGDGYYVNDLLSAYRKNVSSISNSRKMSTHILAEIRACHSVLKRYSGNRYNALINKNYQGHVVQYIESRLSASAESLSFFKLVKYSLLLPLVGIGSQYSLLDSLYLVKISWKVFIAHSARVDKA